MNFASPVLSLILWASLIVGFAVQLILSLKCSSTLPKLGFVLFSVLGLCVSEVLCRIITGWDLILYLIVYCVFLCFITGAGICGLSLKLYNKRKNK